MKNIKKIKKMNIFKKNQVITKLFLSNYIINLLVKYELKKYKFLNEKKYIII